MIKKKLNVRMIKEDSEKWYQSILDGMDLWMRISCYMYRKHKNIPITVVVQLANPRLYTQLFKGQTSKVTKVDDNTVRYRLRHQSRAPQNFTQSEIPLLFSFSIQNKELCPKLKKREPYE